MIVIRIEHWWFLSAAHIHACSGVSSKANFNVEETSTRGTESLPAAHFCTSVALGLYHVIGWRTPFPGWHCNICMSSLTITPLLRTYTEKECQLQHGAQIVAEKNMQGQITGQDSYQGCSVQRERILWMTTWLEKQKTPSRFYE